mmetsp:Transcript_64772/g.182709  ORF Transcript_64772/g.182709 Transcript_64772/m.182709 type:complete len:507 (-) Transcript_64772:125-1645(-)
MVRGQPTVVALALVVRSLSERLESCGFSIPEALTEQLTALTSCTVEEGQQASGSQRGVDELQAPQLAARGSELVARLDKEVITLRTECADLRSSLAEQQRRIAAEAMESAGGWSLRLERVREEFAQIRREEVAEAADSATLNHERLMASVSTFEAKSRLEMHELKHYLDATVGKVREERNELVEATRSSTLQSIERTRDEASRAISQLLADVRVDLNHNVQQTTDNIQLLGGQVADLDSRMSRLIGRVSDRLEETEGACRNALIGLRMRDLRAQADEVKQLRLATGSVAQGLRRVAQVCGLLPGALGCGGSSSSIDKLEESRGTDKHSRTMAGQEFSVDDILDLELSGHSIARRVEDAWAAIAPDSVTMLDFMQQRAQEVAWRMVRAEVGDLDSRIQRACHEFALSPSGWCSAPSAGAGAGTEVIRRAPAPKVESSGGLRELNEVQHERNLSSRSGRVSSTSNHPAKAVMRVNAASLVPLSTPRVGMGLRDLRASPDLRVGAASAW